MYFHFKSNKGHVLLFEVKWSRSNMKDDELGEIHVMVCAYDAKSENLTLQKSPRFYLKGANKRLIYLFKTQGLTKMLEQD